MMWKSVIRRTIQTQRWTSTFQRLKAGFSQRAGQIPIDYRRNFTILLLGAVGAIGVSLNSPISLDAKVSDVLLTPDEIKKHKVHTDCWIVIAGKVYDITQFLDKHPGGAGILLKYAGKDASSLFKQIHSQELITMRLSPDLYLGEMVGEFEEEVVELTEEEVIRLQNLENKPDLDQIFDLHDFEYVLKKILPKTAYTYFATGCDDEFSLRENHYSYNRIFFRPKILGNTETVSLETEMMGCKVEAPFYITAFAGSLLAHPLAERNLCHGAYREKIIEMVPTQLSFPYKEFMSEVPEDQEHWAQVHFYSEDDVKNSRAKFERFENSPSVKGVFVNADIDALGNREKDQKVRALYDTNGSLSEFTNATEVRPTLTWDDIKRFKSETKLPIGLKGVQCLEDVLYAAQIGVNSVILSNHGGRQLDFSMPPLEVLAECRPLLREHALEDKIEIYLDGGIRRGSDIIKALCLGAKGVGLGRPFLYSMAGYGEEGVVKLIQILKLEMERDMKLLGVESISELNESLIDTRGLKLRNDGGHDTLYDQVYEPLFFPKFKHQS